MTIGTLMSRDICYHGYETASRRISGFNKIDSAILKNFTAREMNQNSIYSLYM